MGVITAFGQSLILPGGTSNFIRITAIIQTLYCLLLINIKYPLPVGQFLQLFQVVSLKSFPNPWNWWFPQDVIPSISPALFQYNGLSGIFLKDVGQHLYLYFLLLIVNECCSFALSCFENENARRIKVKIQRAIGVSKVIVLMSSFSMLIFTAGLTQIIYFKPSSGPINFSFTFAIITLSIYFYLPWKIYQTKLRIEQRSSENSSELLEKYKDLFDGFISKNSQSTNCFILVILLKNFLTAVCIVGLFEIPELEILFQICILIGFITSLAKMRPFQKKIQNFFNILLFSMLMLTYFMILPFLSNKSLDNNEIAVTVVVICIIILSILGLMTIYDVLVSLKEFIDGRKKINMKPSTRRIKRTKVKKNLNEVLHS